MSDTDTTKPELSVGLGNGGVVLMITQGETKLSVTLDIEAAYGHQGHVLAAAITLEQTAYIQRMQEQAETMRLMQNLSASPTSTNPLRGGGLWRP